MEPAGSVTVSTAPANAGKCPSIMMAAAVGKKNFVILRLPSLIDGFSHVSGK
jgi:hypothetical protein